MLSVRVYLNFKNASCICLRGFKFVGFNLQQIENNFLIAFGLIVFLLINRSPINPNINAQGSLARYGILASRPVDVILNECTYN